MIRASYWTSACLDDEPGFSRWIHLYVSQMAWSAGCLDPLLRDVADDVIANVLLADVGLRWLYHPYDGDMDVILPSSAERDALRNAIVTGCPGTRVGCRASCDRSDGHAGPGRRLTLSGKAAAWSRRRCWGQPLRVMHGELGDICPWRTKQVGAYKA